MKKEIQMSKQTTYPTFTKAQQAARELRIKTTTEYKKFYQRDPRLPSKLRQSCPEEWESWAAFFGGNIVDKHPRLKKCTFIKDDNDAKDKKI